jgi:protoheme IX farnesyltransferase
MSLIRLHHFQVLEIKNDAKMKRTMRRPLPSGRISPVHAAMWATSVGAAGTALLACKVRLCLPVLDYTLF